MFGWNGTLAWTRKNDTHSFWQWPHLEYGSIGGATLISQDGRVRWSTLVDTSRSARWLPSGKPVKVFPETRPPQVDTSEHSARKRAEKGLQYLRGHFPDANVPGELVANILEEDTRETRRRMMFDPLLGNLLEIMPSHQYQNECVVVFPMGELCRELNISRISPDESGNMVFIPTAAPTFAFETPILQISSAARPFQWISTPSSSLLIRTHTASSLLRVECSKITRELDITRSETGGIPIADGRILASGPDIIVVNRSGKVYKCNTYHDGKAMQLIRTDESSDDDHFWQLGVTGQNNECFLTSCKAVKHIDLRSASSTDVFSLEHASTILTSFESPTDDYISRITTTADMIWLDDRFRKRPLLSFKHYRSFDRTLKAFSANLSGASLTLLTSRMNGLVSLYDVSRATDNLLHCNSSPSCLPHAESIFTPYHGHALVAFPSNQTLTFLRLCQRGSVHRQDICVARPDDDQQGFVQEGYVTHQWDEDVLALEKLANELQIDFGPAGEKYFSEVNLRGAYETIFAIRDDTRDRDQNTSNDTLARLSDAWKDVEETAENMLTTSDIISRDGDKHLSDTNLLSSSNVDSKKGLDALMRGHTAFQKLADLAKWHYDIQDTSIPTLSHSYADRLHEHLNEVNPVSGEPCDFAAKREMDALEQLVVDLTLSNDVYSARPFAKPDSLSVGERIPNTGMSYSEEPPEIRFGYLRPIRKVGGDHYTDKEQDRGQDPGISSPLGVRLLLAEWQLGTNPRDYSYRDPYGVADIDAQPIPKYRKLPTAPQKRQVAPQQPPLVVAAATQPPAVQAVARAHVADEQAESQPSWGFFEEPMASTQVLPGRFGGRRKAEKRRIGGF